MSCNIDTVLTAAKNQVDSKLASYESQLDILRNINPQDYINEANPRAAFAQAKANAISSVKTELDSYTSAVQAYTNVGSALKELKITAIESVADLSGAAMTALLDLIPGAPSELAAITDFVDAAKDMQCI